MALKDIFYSCVGNKCPRCHEGKVFESNSPFSFKMNNTCSHCGLKYEKEPGFFYGAMYVSYGLMAAVLIAWLVADLMWMHNPPHILLAIVASNMIVLFPLVFRLARLLWLNFFVRYDSSFRRQKHVHT